MALRVICNPRMAPTPHRSAYTESRNESGGTLIEITYAYIVYIYLINFYHIDIACHYSTIYTLCMRCARKV